MRTRSISNPTPGGLFKNKEPSANLVSIDSTILASGHLAASGSLNSVDQASNGDPASLASASSSGGSALSVATTSTPSKEKGGIMGMRKRASSSTAATPSKTALSPDGTTNPLASSPSSASLLGGGSGNRSTRGNKLFLHARSFYTGAGGSGSPASPTSDSSAPGTPTSLGGIGNLFNPAPRPSQAASVNMQGRYANNAMAVGLPRHITLPEFKLLDTRARRQRAVLHSLIVNDIKVKMEEKMEGTKELRKTFKEPKFKEEKKGLGKFGGLLQKKKKKKTRAALFHLISLAIHDQRTSQACILLEELSTATLRKKQPAQANRLFVSAMANSMEAVCITMLDKGFPVSVNSPFITGSASLGAGTGASGGAPGGGTATGTSGATGGGSGVGAFGASASVLAAVGGGGLHAKRLSNPSSANVAAAGGSASSLGAKAISPSAVDYPSYFMAALGLGLDNVVRSMIKRTDVNQSWHGLSPLHVVASRNSVMLVNLLLEHGADPNRGIHLSQYALLRRFKAYSPAAHQLLAAPGSGLPSTSSNVGAAGLKFTGLTGSSVARQHPAGSEPTWVPSVVTVAVTGSSGNATVTGDGAAPETATPPSLAATRENDAAPKEAPPTVTVDSSAVDSLTGAAAAASAGAGSDPSALGDGFLSSKHGKEFPGSNSPTPSGTTGRNSRAGQTGKLTRFSEEYVKGKRVYAVELAAACGHMECVKILLAKMDPKVIASMSFALLVQRNVEMTVMFLRYGVPWNQRDQRGAMAVHLGARIGDLNFVIALQQCGADINAKGESDWTPLHEAISNKRFDIANFLVRNGANVTLTSTAGETPRDLGIRIGIPAAELDDVLSPSRVVPPAVAEREQNVINQVKFIRFTTDHNGPKVALGVVGKVPSFTESQNGGTSTPGSTSERSSTLNANGSTMNASSPGGGNTPSPGSPGSIRTSTTSNSNRNKFTAFLASATGKDRSSLSDADLARGSDSPTSITQKKGFMGGRFNIKRGD
ncbi:Ankyrin repeat domain-containing protein 42 [Phlyctochytrium bullatum]|nr:Ankyrin repeat domain-containing protein 42 [Phlyctochytrium bullatum]